MSPFNRSSDRSREITRLCREFGRDDLRDYFLNSDLPPKNIYDVLTARAERDREKSIRRICDERGRPELFEKCCRSGTPVAEIGALIDSLIRIGERKPRQRHWRRY